MQCSYGGGVIIVRTYSISFPFPVIGEGSEPIRERDMLTSKSICAPSAIRSAPERFTAGPFALCHVVKGEETVDVFDLSGLVATDIRDPPDATCMLFGLVIGHWKKSESPAAVWQWRWSSEIGDWRLGTRACHWQCTAGYTNTMRGSQLPASRRVLVWYMKDAPATLCLKTCHFLGVDNKISTIG